MTTCACGNCQFFDNQSKTTTKHKEKDTGLCRYNAPMSQSTSNGRGMEVDGTPGVVSRRNNRGRHAHKEKVKLTFCPRGEPSPILTSRSHPRQPQQRTL